MLNEIMRHLHNYFLNGVKKVGTFTISDGHVSLPFVTDGEYILIEGSKFNDGVWEYPTDTLTDETFEGVIAVCCPPKSFLDLVTEIEAYEADNKLTGIASESFGGYSYSRVTNAQGNVAGWEDIFKKRLNQWRKL